MQICTGCCRAVGVGGAGGVMAPHKILADLLTIFLAKKMSSFIYTQFSFLEQFLCLDSRLANQERLMSISPDTLNDNGPQTFTK